MAIRRVGALMPLSVIVSSCRWGVAVAAGPFDGVVFPGAGRQGGQAGELGPSAVQALTGASLTHPRPHCPLRDPH